MAPNTFRVAFIFVIIYCGIIGEASRYAGKYSADQSLNAYRDFNDLHVHKRAAQNIPRIPSLPATGAPPVAATGTCSTWGQSHYNTFDGQIYTFPGYCEYILVSDCLDFSFHIYVRNEAAGVCDGSAPCRRWVSIENGDPSSMLELSPRDGGPLVTYKGIPLTLPTEIDGMIIEEISSYILVRSGLGFTLVWDGMEYIDVHVTSASLKGNTCGLCGKYNDDPLDDFSGPRGVVYDDPYDFGLSWKNSADDCFTDTTDTTYRYRYNLPEIQNDVTYLEFEVRAHTDVHISLSSAKSDVDPMYEIVIGGRNDTKSEIRRCKQCRTLATSVRSNGFVNMDTFTKFWIRLENGRISVGDTSSTYPFMYWTDSDPLTVRYLGYSTSTNSIGIFRFCGFASSCITAPPPPAQRCTEAQFPPYFYNNPAYKHLIDAANFARETCKQLMEPPFDACHSVVDVNPYVYACEEDLCSCSPLRDDCACGPFSAYALECSRHDVVLSWRTEDLCPLSCTNGTVYESCGGSCPATCENRKRDCVRDYCLDGCHCPQGQLLENGQCIEPSKCPCEYNNQEYPSGHVLHHECNSCTCSGGLWTDCTNNICGAKCWASGDPHYRTFDNKRYDFQGECTYVLVQDCWDLSNDYSIQAENTPCRSPGVTCTKSVSVKIGGYVVVLEQDFVWTLDGITVDTMPYGNTFLYVEMPSETMIKVTLKNGIEVFWDGTKRVEVLVSAEQFNKTCGLCGTYTNKQNDDFYTRAGDIETNPVSFGNKWKAYGSCPDLPINPPVHPCDLYSQRAPGSETQCRKLKNHDAFKACHKVIDPTSYYRDCLYDVCNCQPGGLCECEVFAQYSLDCANSGVVLDWREQIDQCKVECSNEEMVYRECGPSCYTSCASLSSPFNCTDHCVQGCSCPEGMVLDRDRTCVIPELCSCEMDGTIYQTGDVVQKGCGECTCFGGSFMCSDLKCPLTCGVNEEATDCVPECIKTCNNMHEFEDCTPAQCLEGCKCKDNYVWDGSACILPSQCPCHHAGKSYQSNDVINVDCNKLQCNGTSWTPLTNHDCPVTCVAWGDPHYETFDGKMYGFQGDCEYILVTNYLYSHSSVDFQITATNEPCGTSKTTCTKRVTLTIGQNQETIILDRYLEVPSSSDTFRVTEVGLSVFVHTDIGVTLVWDKKTRIDIKVDPIHKNTVGGLCGTYNGNQEDDFTKSNGGFPVASASEFANSWKTSESCGDAPIIEDPCEDNPHRKPWAQRKCSIIKSDTFKECHNHVPFEEYYAKCLYDACGCDNGGDCECLCTAIAAYAQACNEHDVPIKWRSQELCPIQCDGCFSYDPCVSLCDTCGYTDYTDKDGNCLDTCVEGCKCPEGEYLDDGGECVKVCPEPTTLPKTTTVPTTTTESTTTKSTTQEPSTAIFTTPSSTTGIVTVTYAEPSTEVSTTTPSHPTKKSPTPKRTTSEPVTTDVTTPEPPTTTATTPEPPTTSVTTPKPPTTAVTTPEPPTTTITTPEPPTTTVTTPEPPTTTVSTPSPPTTTVTTPKPPTTNPTTKCVPQPPAICWTEWISDEAPGEKMSLFDEGEFELLADLRKDYTICSNPTDIECTTAYPPYYQASEAGQVLECRPDLGLSCLNDFPIQTCYDYRVRFACPCPDQPPTCEPEQTTVTEPTTLEPTTTVTTTKEHTTQCVDTPIECWSEWMNDEDGGKVPGDALGEFELLDELHDDYQFCDNPTAIECRLATEPYWPYYRTGQDVECSLETGLTCYHNEDGPCYDYEIRVRCECEDQPFPLCPTTAKPTTTISTTTIRPTTDESTTEWFTTDVNDKYRTTTVRTFEPPTTLPHVTSAEPTTTQSTTKKQTPPRTAEEPTETVYVTYPVSTEPSTTMESTTAVEPTTVESTTAEPTTTTHLTTTSKKPTTPHETSEEPSTVESTTPAKTTTKTTTHESTTEEQHTTAESTMEPTTTTPIKKPTPPRTTEEPTEEPTETVYVTYPVSTEPSTTMESTTAVEPTTVESTTAEPTTTTHPTTTTKKPTTPRETSEEPSTVELTTPAKTTKETTTLESTTEEQHTTAESTMEPTTTTPLSPTTKRPTPQHTTEVPTETVYVTYPVSTEPSTTMESTTAVEPTTVESTTAELTTTTHPTTPHETSEEPSTVESTTAAKTTTKTTTLESTTEEQHTTAESTMEPTTTTPPSPTTTKRPTPPHTTEEPTETVYVTYPVSTEPSTTLESTTAVEPTTVESTTAEPTTTTHPTTPHETSEEPSTVESTTAAKTTTKTTTLESTTEEQHTTAESTMEPTTTTPPSPTTTKRPTPPHTTEEPTETVYVTYPVSTEPSTTMESTTAAEPTTVESTTAEPTTTTHPTTPHETSEEPSTVESTTAAKTTTLESTTEEQHTTVESTMEPKTTAPPSPTTTKRPTPPHTTEEPTETVYVTYPVSTEPSTTLESTTAAEPTTVESTTAEPTTTTHPTTPHETSEELSTVESTTAAKTTTKTTTFESTTEEQHTTAESTMEPTTTAPTKKPTPRRTTEEPTEEPTETVYVTYPVSTEPTTTLESTTAVEQTTVESTTAEPTTTTHPTTTTKKPTTPHETSEEPSTVESTTPAKTTKETTTHESTTEEQHTTAESTMEPTTTTPPSPTTTKKPAPPHTTEEPTETVYVTYPVSTEPSTVKSTTYEKTTRESTTTYIVDYSTAAPTTILTTTTSPTEAHADTTVPVTIGITTPDNRVCECNGYGDPHYFTFDGKRYDHQGNCTYILSRDASPEHQFTVLIHNEPCRDFPGTTCPESITVLYKNYSINMQHDLEFNVSGTIMYAPAYFDGIELRQNGLKMMVIIASLGLEVRFEPPSPRYYRVIVSPQLFWNKTEGLCGLCNGNPEDDYISREGKVIENVNDFGNNWLEPMPGEGEHCIPVAEPTPCIPSQEVIDWCGRFNSTEFRACHPYVDPGEYYKTCLRDGCANATAGNCWAFESYAEECSGQKICIPWRSEDFCPEPCPDGLVYRQCNCPIAEVDNCPSWDGFECPLDPISGCFCPEGSVPDGSHPTNMTCVPCEATPPPPTGYPTTKAPGEGCILQVLDPVEVRDGPCIGNTSSTACLGTCESSYRITGYQDGVPITEKSCPLCEPTEFITEVVNLVCPGNLSKQVEVQKIHSCHCYQKDHVCPDILDPK